MPGRSDLSAASAEPCTCGSTAHRSSLVDEAQAPVKHQGAPRETKYEVLSQDDGSSPERRWSGGAE